MRNTKTILIIALLAVVLFFASVLTKSPPPVITGSGEKVFPELLNRANDATYVKIERQSETTTLVKVGSTWKIKEKGQYPADLEKVRELVLGVAGLLFVEPKTSKPENYAKIGLQDVHESGATGTQLSITDGSDKQLVDFIVGNSRPARADNSQSEYYIRIKDNPQSWLAQGKLPTQWNTTNWLDTLVLELSRERIQKVVVTHKDGEIVSIHREDSSARDFTLDKLKEGEEIKAAFEVNNIATSFTTMRFDDVKTNSEADLQKPDFVALLTAFDGLEIQLEVFKLDDKNLLSRLKASFNEAVAQASQEKVKQQIADAHKPAEPANTGDSASAETPHSPPSAPDKKPMQIKDSTEVKKEVEELNARWSGWLYKLPEFRTSNISKKKKELLKDV